MRACPQCGTEYPDDVPFCQKDGTRLTDTDTVEEGARPAGTVVGSYRLIRLLGEGGMGFVYLAEHTRLGRKVALKMLRSRYSSNPVAIKRFFREARSVNRINHENIVEITDFIEQEGEDNYYIMEWLEGESVADILEREGRVGLSRALAIAIQVCDALSAVHHADIVHRDLKPDNIFLVRRHGREDFVKLLDFGVAKLADPVEAKGHQTAGGAILGTPEYMSPEQASSKPVDFRTDIYALGVILYQMLTGQQPFTGQSYGELVIKHVTIPPVPPSQLGGMPVIPGPLEKLILQCLEKEPANRPENMRQIQSALEEIGRGREVQPEDPVVLRQKARRPYKLLAGAVGLLVVAGGVLATMSFLQGSPGKQAPVQSSGVKGPVAPVGVFDAGAPVAETARVRVAFDSVPRGAAVTRNGSERPLGTTPLTVTFEATPDPQTFEFHLAGYLPLRREVSLQDDKRVMARLARKKRRNRLARRKQRKKTKKPEGKREKTGEKTEKKTPRQPTPEDLGGTLDPFKNEQD